MPHSRAVNGAPSRHHAYITDTRASSYLDDVSRIRGSVIYKIILHAKDGGVSAMSDSVVVRLN